MLRCVVAMLLVASSALPQVTQTAPALRTDVQLVSVDVVVTDKHGVPVHGLKQGDFAVLDEKAPQPLKGFEEHTSAPPAPPSQPGERGVIRNTPQVPGGAVDVLLLDALNTPSDAQPYLRDQLVQFLAAERPGRQVAIFALNQRLGLLQDFTTDQELLKRAVKARGVKFSPLLQTELDDSFIHKTSDVLSDLAATASPSDAGDIEKYKEMQSTLLDMDARAQSAQTQVRARLTLDALEQLARYLAGVPGRKNVLWFSGAFPAVIQRDIQTTGDPFAGNADLSPELKRTIGVLAQNQVAVYPIDARGLEPPPSKTVSADTPTANIQRMRATYGTTSLTPQDDKFRSDRFFEHSTMDFMADGTGGRAFYNSNGLSQAMEQATRDGESYYTLQYTPPAGKPNQVHGIQVKLKQPGLQLAYRKTYALASTSPATLDSTLAQAMTPDAANSSEVSLQVRPRVAVNFDEAKVIGAKNAGSSPHAVYSLRVLIKMDDLRMTATDDGKMHGSLLFATVLYAKNGKVIDSRKDRGEVALDPARYQVLLKNGLAYHTEVALPNDDSVGYVRVAVQDATTARVGTVRVAAEQLRAATADASLHP